VPIREVAFQLQAGLPLKDEPATFLHQHVEVHVGQRRFRPIGETPGVRQEEAQPRLGGPGAVVDIA
jgi:hypothetical protein